MAGGFGWSWLNLQYSKNLQQKTESLNELARLGTKLEREAGQAVDFFAFRPLEGFLMAIKTGDKLLDAVEQESIANINRYPAIRPMSSINELLNKTQAEFVA